MKRELAPGPKAWVPTTVIVDDEGNFRFQLISNGFTREQWGVHLERRGWKSSPWWRNVLHCASEAATCGLVYNVIVRPGNLIINSERTNYKICEAAKKKDWSPSHWELSCLSRDNLTDEQLVKMGLLGIVTMHQPIITVAGSDLLFMDLDEKSGGLHAACGRSDYHWSPEYGFEFVESILVPNHVSH